MLTPFYPEEVAKRNGGKTGDTDIRVGVVLASINVSGFITSIVFGKYMDKIGAKFLVIAGAFLMGGSTLIFGFVCEVNEINTFTALSTAIRFVMGMGEGAFDTTALAIGLTMFPSRIATVWAIFEMSAGLGVTAGPPLGGLVYDTYGFLVPFLLVGTMILVCVAFLSCLLPNISEAAPQSAASIWPLLKMLPVTMALLSVFWSFCALSMLFATLPVDLKDNFKWSPSKISTALVTTSGAYGVSALLFGRLADATNPRCFVIAGLLSQGCAMLLVGPSFLFTSLTTEPWMIYLGMAIIGVGSAATLVPAGSDMIRNAIAKGYEEGLWLNGSVSGLVTAITFLAGAVGSQVGGILTAVYGFRYSTSFIAFAILAHMIATLLMTIVQLVSQPSLYTVIN